MKKTNTELSRLRVAKTYAPEQDGAKRFARRYGGQLVCVRHRLTEDGATRHTTVELLVETTPVASRARSVIAVRIPHGDKRTRTLLLACGALWRPREKYWLVPQLVAKNLRLLRHYNNIISERRGTPMLTLVAKYTPGSKLLNPTGNSHRDIQFLESMLISNCMSRNFDLYNKRDTKLLREMVVPGLLNTSQGKAASSVGEFRSLVGG